MRYLNRLQSFLNEVFKNTDEVSAVYATAPAIQHIRSERTQVADEIHKQIFELGGDKARTVMLIADIQNEIALFSNRYFPLVGSAKDSDSVTSSLSTSAVVEVLLAEMDLLYITLKENYPEMFDWELAVPLSLRDRQLAASRQCAKAVILELKKREVDIVLVSLMTEYLDTAIKLSGFSLANSRDIDYYTFATGHLSRLLERSVTANFQEELFRELIYLNFNSLPLINYYLKQVQLDYDQVENYHGELIRLIIDLRNLKSLPVHPQLAYQPGGISLKEILSGAIVEEIACIEHLQRIQEKKSYKDWPSGIISPFYFHVTLTLEQLTFLFRVMIEAGIVIVKKKLELFDFIAKHIGTTNKDNLASRSIKNKYGNPSALTVQKVKHVLLMLVNLINERYPA